MKTRLASFSGLAVAAVAMLAASPFPAPAQQPAGQVVRFGEGQTLTISGFISATLFSNRGLFGAFGQGQNAEYAAAPAAQLARDQMFTDGDVRNTRINFTFAATPVLGKWSPRGVLEADFFGAFPSGPPPAAAPPFADEQPQLRIRFAYADLTNGRTTIRVGQFWSPIFGETPVSLSHLAFPIGYGASGKIGWRFPGVYVYHDLNPGKPVIVQLQLGVFEGSGPATAGADANNSIGQGEASGLPQLEATLTFTKRSPKLSWSAYAAGHIDWKDTTGTNVSGDNLTGVAVEFGGNIVRAKFSVRGNFYYGKAIGQQFGHITQQGNVRGYGAWAQLGYDFTPRWSYFLYYGIDNPDERRFAQDNPGVAGGLARKENQDAAAMLRFRAGRYALGLEYLRAMTRWNTGLTNTEQFALSVLYTL
jgi:hypothetical protein